MTSPGFPYDGSTESRWYWLEWRVRYEPFVLLGRIEELFHDRS